MRTGLRLYGEELAFILLNPYNDYIYLDEGIDLNGSCLSWKGPVIGLDGVLILNKWMKIRIIKLFSSF